MRISSPLRLRHGPLTVWMSAVDGCPDLRAIAGAVPRGAPVVWLDSARTHPVTGRWSLLGADPWLTLAARGTRMECRTTASTRVWRAQPLDALREVLRRYRAPRQAAPQARALGLLGYLSYEMNRWIERLPPAKPGGGLPEMAWYGMRRLWLVDHQEQRGWAFSIVDPHAPALLAQHQALEALDAMREQAQRAVPPPASGASGGVEATGTQADFERMVDRALEYIRAGDIFQANVAQRFTAAWQGSAWPLYDALRRINPSPFACWLSSEEVTVASASPERLIRVQEGRIDTRPIAGTRPRGSTPAEDALQGAELLLSDKERAEHIMLVDLARNDLGRVCVPGSVGVDEMMTLEAYSHVQHIVSGVAGRLRRGMGPVEVIRAVFPGGTITGCPKVRCMEILHRLEPVARGLYTGSLGVLGFDGTMDLNIAIRTLVIQGGRLSFHVGAGIVADSVPEREYHETLAKAAALMAAVNGVPRLGSASLGTTPSAKRQAQLPVRNGGSEAAHAAG